MRTASQHWLKVNTVFGFVRKAPLIDSETVAWQFECFSWLLRNSGGFPEFKNTVLVQPTNAFFPQRGLSGQDLAEAIFTQVKEYAGMSEWPCRLEPQEEDPDPVIAPTVVVRGAPSSAAGTFSTSEEGVVITYNPAGLSNPVSLIATFAHELAHYFTGVFPEAPPGGWENREFATDLASVFLGFGIFAANSCFTFSQFTSVGSHGWQSHRLGYLSEPELLHAQAVLSALLEIPSKDVIKHLKPSLRGLYKRACKDVAAQNEKIKVLKCGAAEFSELQGEV